MIYPSVCFVIWCSITGHAVTSGNWVFTYLLGSVISLAISAHWKNKFLLALMMHVPTRLKVYKYEMKTYQSTDGFKNIVVNWTKGIRNLKLLLSVVHQNSYPVITIHVHWKISLVYAEILVHQSRDNFCSIL